MQKKDYLNLGCSEIKCASTSENDAQISISKKLFYSVAVVYRVN